VEQDGRVLGPDEGLAVAPSLTFGASHWWDTCCIMLDRLEHTGALFVFVCNDLLGVRLLVHKEISTSCIKSKI
jgi:hypothetical protein